MPLGRRLPRVDATRFSMVPRADVPRSTFQTSHTVKSAFHTGYLIPLHVDEVLPGDVHQGKVTVFARLATPLFPIMDNMTLESFFFFVPCRLLWDNWKKMMGERANPADSISYAVPYQASAPSGFPVNSIFDYFGLPTVGQVTAGQDIRANALPLRAYNLIYNEWFRDQNLQDSLVVSTGNGPDTIADYALRRRNKKHDYFTAALPWPLKGGVEVSMPLSGSAPVKGLAVSTSEDPTNGDPGAFIDSRGIDDTSGWAGFYGGGPFAGGAIVIRASSASPGQPMIFADLSTATGATINALRLAVQTQRLLERDARSGTRYTELLRAHFGVEPEDTRLQRPEYIGGGRTSINTQAIPQTSAQRPELGASPLGTLGGAATASDQHRFSYHAKEHGYIIGLIHATADITYQQGIHRLWTRLTRYDFYWPVFANLGEQIIRNDEIYATGDSVVDEAAFGYQERWAEYRHRPSRITGNFRSTHAASIDIWHLAQEFASLPTLNTTFIQDNPPFERVLAAGALADNMQILMDSVFNIRTTRAMPMFSVPGMMDRL